MEASDKRTSGRHHGDLRNALEQAALDLVAEKGVNGFTLAEASRRAGVSVAAPYRHFSDKDALLAALAQKGYERQYERFSQAIAGESDPVEQLAAFAAAYVHYSSENRALFEIAFSAGLRKYLYPDLAQAGNRVLGLLQESAELLRTDPDAALDLIHAVGAIAHGFASFLAEGVFGEPSEALELTKRRARDVTRKVVRS